MSSSLAWDERYAGGGFQFGAQPNLFLRGQAYACARGCTRSRWATARGANGVWLAAQGARGHRADWSAVGLAKARGAGRRAGRAPRHRDRDVARGRTGRLRPSRWSPGSSCICRPRTAPRLRRPCCGPLAPGGLVLLECFTPAQQGGAAAGEGPRAAVVPPARRGALPRLEVLELLEGTVALDEGPRHSGPGGGGSCRAPPPRLTGGGSRHAGGGGGGRRSPAALPPLRPARGGSGAGPGARCGRRFAPAVNPFAAEIGAGRSADRHGAVFAAKALAEPSGIRVHQCRPPSSRRPSGISAAPTVSPAMPASSAPTTHSTAAGAAGAARPAAWSRCHAPDAGRGAEAEALQPVQEDAAAHPDHRRGADDGEQLQQAPACRAPARARWPGRSPCRPWSWPGRHRPPSR